jgi:hypothetical protein
MLKKMMLLAMAVGALAAFAAPSMVSANEWYTGEETIGNSTESGDAVHFTGKMTLTRSGLRFICNATSNVVLWNEAGAAVGEASLTLAGPCTVEALVIVPTTWVHINGCSVNPSTSGENWPISTSGSVVAIEESNYEIEFQGCGVLGIPNGSKISDGGTMTGVVEGECLVFAGAGDLPNTVVDGFICPTFPGLGLR